MDTTNFQDLIFGTQIIMWVWMATMGIHMLFTRVRTIVHDRTYVITWYDFVTGISTVGLMVTHGVI